MESKLRECFDEMVVYKDLKRSNFFSSLGLPSFLRDWVLKKFEDDEGNYDIEEVHSDLSSQKGRMDQHQESYHLRKRASKDSYEGRYRY